MLHNATRPYQHDFIPMLVIPCRASLRVGPHWGMCTRGWSTGVSRGQLLSSWQTKPATLPLGDSQASSMPKGLKHMRYLLPPYSLHPLPSTYYFANASADCLFGLGGHAVLHAKIKYSPKCGKADGWLNTVLESCRQHWCLRGVVLRYCCIFTTT